MNKPCLVTIGIILLAGLGGPASARAQSALAASEARGVVAAAVPGASSPSATADALNLQRSSVAQPRHEGIGIGAEFGPIFSSFDQASTDFKNNTGLEGGIFFGGNRPGAAGLMGKLLYAKKGAKSASGTAVDLYYFEIPVLIRLNAGSSSLSGVLVYGIGGPVFDILLKGEQGNLDVKDNYESIDLGVQFGAGVEISRFIVEGVYTKGLRNVLKSAGGGITDIKTHSFAVLFGLRFN